MKLIDDAKKLWPRLWSVRFALLAALASAIQVAFIVVIGGGSLLFALLALALAAAAAVARVIRQEKLQAEIQRGAIPTPPEL